MYLDMRDIVKLHGLVDEPANFGDPKRLCSWTIHMKII